MTELNESKVTMHRFFFKILRMLHEFQQKYNKKLLQTNNRLL